MIRSSRPPLPEDDAKKLANRAKATEDRRKRAEKDKKRDADICQREERGKRCWSQEAVGLEQEESTSESYNDSDLGHSPSPDLFSGSAGPMAREASPPCQL